MLLSSQFSECGSGDKDYVFCTWDFFKSPFRNSSTLTNSCLFHLHVLNLNVKVIKYVYKISVKLFHINIFLMLADKVIQKLKHFKLHSSNLLHPYRTSIKN